MKVCAVSEIQCKPHLLLCTYLLIILILVTSEWLQLELQSQLCLWIFTSYGLCHFFWHCTPLILYGSVSLVLSWSLVVRLSSI